MGKYLFHMGVAIWGLASLCMAGPLNARADGGRPETMVGVATQRGGLEPYLKESLGDLMDQIKADGTQEVVRHRAIMRVVTQYPEQAPDALVSFVNQPAGHLTEFTSEVLFRLGRPNSKTNELLGHIREGRSQTLEAIAAFSKAVAWPGNRAAIATLRMMIDEGWDTANVARLCIARIQDTDGPHDLLELPYYAPGKGDYNSGSLNYAQRVPQLLRTLGDLRVNEALLKDGNPAKAVALWEGDGIYALAWPGNKALADAYLKAKGPSYQFHIAAARTRDERCLKALRALFEKEAADFLQADSGSQSDAAHNKWIWIAGVESANDASTATLVKLLAVVEQRRQAAEADAKARFARGEMTVGQPDTDPLGRLRDVILRGLCVNPLARTKEIVRPYVNDTTYDWGFLAGIALLRSGDPEGLRCLLNRWPNPPTDELQEAILVYSGMDLLTRMHGTPNVGLENAEAWYAQSKDGQVLRERIARVNESGLSQSLVEPLMLWP